MLPKSIVPAAFSCAIAMTALLSGAPLNANMVQASEQPALSAPTQDETTVAPVPASDTEESAITAARAYLAVHNEHDLERVMNYYTPDATFQLSNGRELIRGRDNIRELERFDAIAKSTLIPFGWSARKTGEGWEVSVRGVLENSIIFSAVGLKLVVAKPDKPVFLLRNGLIQHSEQPALLPACLAATMTAFDGVANWLAERNDPRTKGLISNARLKLEPHLLPMIAQLITEWRTSTGWSPSSAQIRDCGSVDAIIGH